MRDRIESSLKYLLRDLNIKVYDKVEIFQEENHCIGKKFKGKKCSSLSIFELEYMVEFLLRMKLFIGENIISVIIISSNETEGYNYFTYKIYNNGIKIILQ